jgi:hypothetical protein
MAISMEQHKQEVRDATLIHCLRCPSGATIQEIAIAQWALVLVAVEITVTIPIGE